MYYFCRYCSSCVSFHRLIFLVNKNRLKRSESFYMPAGATANKSSRKVNKCIFQCIRFHFNGCFSGKSVNYSLSSFFLPFLKDESFHTFPACPVKHNKFIFLRFYEAKVLCYFCVYRNVKKVNMWNSISSFGHIKTDTFYFIIYALRMWTHTCVIYYGSIYHWYFCCMVLEGRCVVETMINHQCNVKVSDYYNSLVNH